MSLSPASLNLLPLEVIGEMPEEVRQVTSMVDKRSHIQLVYHLLDAWSMVLRHVSMFSLGPWSGIMMSPPC